MVIDLSPEDFARKQAALRVKFPEAAVTGAAGTLTSKDVTLAYAYDGAGALTVTVLQKHSMKAKLAPESTLESKIRELFAGL